MRSIACKDTNESAVHRAHLESALQLRNIGDRVQVADEQRAGWGLVLRQVTNGGAGGEPAAAWGRCYAASAAEAAGRMAVWKGRR